MAEDPIDPRTLDIPSRPTTIRVFFSQGTLRFTARSLTFSEIQSVILQARNTGWFGNGQVVDAVVRAGLDADPRQIKSARRDIHLLANTARYVWILTLHRLAQFTNRIHTLLGQHGQVRARFYRYADLATPALVHFLKEKASSVDVEKYFDAFFRHAIASARVGTKTLSCGELRRRLRDQREQVAVGFLRAMIGEKRPLDALPASIFSSVDERFFCFQELMNTLDWWQLGRIVEAFNIATNVLVFHSNQLGGLTTAPEEARLVTGMPAIWHLLGTRVPVEVSMAVVQDAVKGDLRRLSAPHRRVVQEAYGQGLRELREHALSIGTKPSDAEITRRVVTGFARAIAPHSRIRRSLCFAYWNEFSTALSRWQMKEASALRDELRAALPPDCYLLVEGASDQICFRGFLEIAKSDARVEVLDCGSKSQVVAKFRTIVEHQLFIGGIITVLDHDAVHEADELQRLGPGRCRVLHFRLQKGEIEDLFSAKSHAEAINRWSPGPETILPGDLKARGRIAVTLKQAAWARKKVSFDKRAHAAELLRKVKHRRQIPAEARTICDRTIELARRVRDSRRHGPSVVDVDQQMRQLARKLL